MNDDNLERVSQQEPRHPDELHRRRARRCQTCNGPYSRETTGLVCQTCGWDYGKDGKP